MTNKQIIRDLYDIHDRMRRSLDVVFAHLEAIETVSDAPHSRLHTALDALYDAARAVLCVKNIIADAQAKQEQEEAK